MTLEEQFEDATRRVKEVKTRPSNEELLALYSLYKQAADGDVHGEKPGMFDFVESAKYKAWEKLKGMDQTEAKKTYIAKAEEVINKYG